MKKGRFTEEQIVAILAEADRGEGTIGGVCRSHGVSEATFYNWRKRFRGMEVDDVREYRRLKQENARLKKLLADRELEIDAMKKVMRKKSGSSRESMQKRAE